MEQNLSQKQKNSLTETKNEYQKNILPEVQKRQKMKQNFTQEDQEIYDEMTLDPVSYLLNFKDDFVSIFDKIDRIIPKEKIKNIIIYGAITIKNKKTSIIPCVLLYALEENIFKIIKERYLTYEETLTCLQKPTSFHDNFMLNLHVNSNTYNAPDRSNSQFKLKKFIINFYQFADFIDFFTFLTTVSTEKYLALILPDLKITQQIPKYKKMLIDIKSRKNNFISFKKLVVQSQHKLHTKIFSDLIDELNLKE